MTTDPRAALTALVAALERHLEAAAARRGENDPVVLAAYKALAEAFEDYDDALLDAFDEVTPLEVFHGEEEDEDFDEDDEFDEPDDVEGGGAYTGLDDEDYDDEPEGTPSGAPRSPDATRM
ncbi:MAG TPA: DNA primase [Actinomycetales bacterium]|nr:DNA primase [Actinomycetales bacterium]